LAGRATQGRQRLHTHRAEHVALSQFDQVAYTQLACRLGGQPIVRQLKTLASGAMSRQNSVPGVNVVS
jgi:class 3 adenylate cyclase